MRQAKQTKQKVKVQGISIPQSSMRLKTECREMLEDIGGEI